MRIEVVRMHVERVSVTCVIGNRAYKEIWVIILTNGITGITWRCRSVIIALAVKGRPLVYIPKKKRCFETC